MGPRGPRFTFTRDAATARILYVPGRAFLEYMDRVSGPLSIRRVFTSGLWIASTYPLIVETAVFLPVRKESIYSQVTTPEIKTGGSPNPGKCLAHSVASKIHGV